MGALMWKVLGTGSVVLSGVAARKVITTAWRKGTGHPPPANPTSPNTGWIEAISWAVFSGALIGVARMLAARKAADYYVKSTGGVLPKRLQEVT